MSLGMCGENGSWLGSYVRKSHVKKGLGESGTLFSRVGCEGGVVVAEGGNVGISLTSGPLT